MAAPRKRGRRGSSEPPPTYAPTQPPGRGDGDRKRSRQVIDRLRLVLHRPGRQSSKGDRAAVCRCANGRERGRAGGSGRIGRGPDHHLFPARVSARPGGVQRDRDQPHQPPAGRPHPAPGGTHRRIPAGPARQRPLPRGSRSHRAARLQHPRRTRRHTRNPSKTWNPPTTPHNTRQRNPGMASSAIPGFSLPPGAQLCPSCSRFRAPQSSPLRFLVPGVRTPIRLMNAPG